MYLQGSAGVMFLSQGPWSYPSHRENLTHNITSELITTLSTPFFFFFSGLLPKSKQVGEGTVCICMSLQGAAEPELTFAPRTLQL